MPKAPLKAVLAEVAARVRERRQKAGLTQEQAASHAGIDYKRYQRIEQGAVNVTIRTLHRIANAVGTDFWTLMGGNR